MEATLRQLERLGFRVTLNVADQVNVKFVGHGTPDMVVARPLINALKANKPNIVAVLRKKKALPSKNSEADHWQFVEEALKVFPGAKLLPTPLTRKSWERRKAGR